MIDHNSHSATVQGYLDAINTSFCLQNFDAPANLMDRSNMCYKIVLAGEREENIARQRSPISREMFTALLDQAKESSADSLKTGVADWFTFIRITGLRCTEYAQKTQSAIDKHKYPLGKCVVKAFIPSNWKIFNSKSRVINVHSLHGEPKEFLSKLRITFQIQKNRWNGQKITLVANNVHADVCPVRAAYRIFLQSKRLGQSDSKPMAVFVNKFGITRYLTGGKIADVLQSVAKAVHPDLSADKIKRFSSHSGRVWALVLLDKAAMTPDFMTSHLR